MRALFLGEIVGRAGVTAVKKFFKSADRKYDFCVANGEGATNGFGLTRELATLLLRSGVDVITGGEKIFFKHDMADFISSSSKVLRPLNMNLQSTPGHGIRYISIADKKCAIVNLVGHQDVKMLSYSSVYSSIDWMLSKLKEQGISDIFVQVHAQATAEKKCIFYYLDGKVTAVVGTHTKVMTADCQISKNGTAYITDNGRCGSFLSVGGLEPSVEIKKEKLGRLFYSKECFDEIELQGVEIDSDENSKAVSITSIKHKIVLDDEDYAMLKLK